MGTILVQISDRAWTMKAMHFACAIARNTQSRLTLLHLIQVRSPYLLGTELGIIPPPSHELEEIDEYDMIAEDYGLEVTLQPMRIVSLTSALVQAAEYLHASVVFMHVPENVFPFWHKLQLWNLRRQLTAQGCQLYTLDEPIQNEDWVPSMSLKATK
jgi:hypothetical protein